MVHAAMLDIAHDMKPLQHGTHAKNMFVCHESVSYNQTGWSDVKNLESALLHEGYGIHGITDAEGHKAWTRGLGNAVFWHAGDVNGVAVGVENISEIPILIEAKKLTHAQAHEAWLHRPKQLSALAILIACWHNADKKNHPLTRSNGKIGSAGICSHWNVSQHYASSQGHWDCWPFDEGGYFPLAHVIELAKVYAEHYEF